jgi:hypothetical protein
MSKWCACWNWGRVVTGAADIGPQEGGEGVGFSQAPPFDPAPYCAYTDDPWHRCVDSFGLESSVVCWATNRRLDAMHAHPTNPKGTR